MAEREEAPTPLLSLEWWLPRLACVEVVLDSRGDVGLTATHELGEGDLCEGRHWVFGLSRVGDCMAAAEAAMLPRRAESLAGSAAAMIP